MPTGIYKWKPFTKKRCLAISRARKGIVFSEEHRQNIARSWTATRKKKQKSYGQTFKGGCGQRPVKFVLEMNKILKPLGYVREYAIGLSSVGLKNYKVDFALVKEKVAIECDGPRHTYRKQQTLDKKKDKILCSLGWKIIRVPHE